MNEKWKRCIEDDRNGPDNISVQTLPKNMLYAKFNLKGKMLTQ